MINSPFTPPQHTPLPYRYHSGRKKTKMLVLVGVVALTLGLIGTIGWYNYRLRHSNLNVEVTFTEPRQAIVFWKTPHKTIGSVRYGPSQSNRPYRSVQTSSQPDVIHAVILNDIPLEGTYISLHNKSDGRLYWPEVVFIKFDPASHE